MEGEIKKIKIKELPQSATLHDEDIFVESDNLETYKITAGDIAKYISANEYLANTYTAKASIGASDGIAPLNSDQKVDGSFITYGTTANTAYEGSNGKILEQNMDNHLTDTNPHGLKTTIINALQEAKDYANQVKSDIIGGLPDETLDTIVELGEKLKDESDALNVLVETLGEKVDKEAGKQLSTNDYTTEEKTKLNSIEENANHYTLPIATASVPGGVKIGTNITNTDGSISITKKNITDALGYTPGNNEDNAYSVFVGATAAADGESGLVPAPMAGEELKYLKGDGTFATPTDTKNTAGSENTNTKIFLIGTKNQTSAAKTYSHDTVYIDDDGDLCSNDTKVSLNGHAHNEYVTISYSAEEPANQKNGDYWVVDYE